MLRDWGIAWGATLVAGCLCAPLAAEDTPDPDAGAAPPPAAAAAPAAAPSPDAVAELVRQLDAERLVDRDAAEARLVELGPAVLELLPEPGPRISAEVRQRLARVRQALLTARARLVATASRVGWNKTPATLSELLTAWEQASGNRLVDYREQFGQAADDPAIDFTIDEQDFWPALDALADRLSLTVYPYAGEPVLALVARGTAQRPRVGRGAYAGAFRIEALRMDAHRDLRDAAETTLALGLEFAWEPRLRPVGLVLDPLDLAIRDDQDRAVEAVESSAEYEAMVNPGSVSAEFDIPLAPPADDARQLASVRGTATVLLPAGTEELRFAKLDGARNESQRRGGVVVTLESMRKNNDVWEARLRVAFDETSGALESHRGWVYDNEALLLDPQGNAVPHDGYQTTSESENEVGVAYLFDLPAGPAGYTLVYKTPVVILRSTLEFELRDLPLP